MKKAMSTDKPFSTLSCAIVRHRGLVGIASPRVEAALTTGTTLAQPKVNKTATSSNRDVFAANISSLGLIFVSLQGQKTKHYMVTANFRLEQRFSNRRRK